MLLYINFPEWITPDVFGAFDLPKWLSFLNLLRWYGIAYIVGIMIAYYQGLHIIKTEKPNLLTKKRYDDYIFWAVIGLVLGGRIFSCLVYDFNTYIKNPLAILLPFQDGKFVGFQGMAYHGAVIGVFVVSLLFVRKHKIIFRDLCDVVFPSIPLGYTLGRIANFINGELWGRITASPIGVIFPEAQKLPISIPEVQGVIDKIGWHVNAFTGTVIDSAGNDISGVLIKTGQEILINLPRYPSQLFQALFEGLILFFILWFIARTYKPFKGFTAVVYLGVYSIFRFFIEFMRQPDMQFADISKGKYNGFVLGIFSMGQVLCLITLAFSVGLFFYFRSLSINEKPKRR